MVASSGYHFLIIACVGIFLQGVNGADIFLEWNVTVDNSLSPVQADQPVILINGQFPGPLINGTTNDMIHVNVFNNIDEPLLFTWNGIQQRLNSWQDGVSGTNCAIQPGKNWTYQFQMKDQIGSFFYFHSINFQKAAGGFGPIRVNNRNVIAVPFPKPEEEFDLLIGDWLSGNYKDYKNDMNQVGFNLSSIQPSTILMNGKAPLGNSWSGVSESFTVSKGKTYRFRISNVGTMMSFNFLIQNHKMVLVETEGSYTNQTTLDSLDVHVGQSYSVLVTADQDEDDYYIVAAPKLRNDTNLVGIGQLIYTNSKSTGSQALPVSPDPFDIDFSVNQAKSIRWNLTAGAARPNPQGTFNVHNITLSQTFILHNTFFPISGINRYGVNNVSYDTPSTPLKLADQFANGSGVYELDSFPTNSVNGEAAYGVSVVTGIHKGWLELVFQNNFDDMDSWHLDGFGLYVVGFGNGDWTEEARNTYNLYDPVVRSTMQVYPRRWTAAYAYLDNPGMWNLRSQHLKSLFLGQELYIRVYDPDPNPAKENSPPENIILCGNFAASSFAPSPAAP